MKFLDLSAAAAALARGEAVIMPTDTVYGLGVAPSAAASPRTLFQLKGRPDGKPVAWLVGGPDDLDRYGEAVPEGAWRLARRYWPGALTLVVRASAAVPPAFRSATGTIGLRMPASPEALALIGAVGAPLAVTSANLSGAPAPATAAQIDPVLAARTAGVLEGACGGTGIASTVVDCTAPRPVILRPGLLDPRELEEYFHE